MGIYSNDYIILKKKLNASFFDKKDMVERIKVKRRNKKLSERVAFLP
jgi:hypothetical protein